MSTQMIEAPVRRQRIAMAIEQIATERQRYVDSQWERVRLEAAIAAIDGIVEDLELRNLSGTKTVPGTWQPRLDRLVANLPVQPPSPLRAAGSTVHLMDALFNLQGMLLRVKAARSPEMDQADAAIEGDLAPQPVKS